MVRPRIKDRSEWQRGHLVHDKESRMLLCVNDMGKVVGYCMDDISPVIVKRWIVKVGEFKCINILNQQKFIEAWNRKMVEDDDDKYQ
ncbi:hypothetical protein BpsM61_00029 [Bacillus phage vB_BpsM-61]|nr:hypothetical protein BpsM61_00029 [Bacillus phage vB_BpsM-61]